MNIEHMTREEVNIVLKRVKNRLRQLDQQKAASLNIGDRVEFIDNKGCRQVGTIEKFNRKTVTVRVMHVRWRVPVSFLKKVVYHFEPLSCLF